MLVLTAVEVVFFTASRMRLCFGSVLNTALIAQRCCCYCWAGIHRAKVSPGYHTALQMRRLLAPGSLRGDTAGTGGPNWSKGCSRRCNIRLSVNSGGRGKKKGIIWSDAVCPPKSPLVWWGPALLEMNTCPTTGSSEFIPSAALLACVAFAYPIINCLYLSPWVL